MKKKKSNLLVAGIAATVLVFSSVGPMTASAQIYDEIPDYVEVVELVDENGKYIYIEATDKALIAKEQARINKAIADRDNPGNDDSNDDDGAGKDSEPEDTNKDENTGSDDNSTESEEPKETEANKPSESKPSKTTKNDSNKVSAEKPSVTNDSKKKDPVKAKDNAVKTESKDNVVNTESKKVEKPKKPAYKVDKVTKKEAEDFVSKYSGDIKAVAKDENLYASVMVAQAIMATNYGKTYLASENMNNLMGLKGSYKGSSVLLNSSEGKQNYKKYSSVKEGFEDYVNLMNKDMYKASSKDESKTYKEAVEAVAKNYALDPNYASKLKSIIDMYDLAELDK